MMPMNLSFRRMLLSHSPRLKSVDVERLENLMTLRHQYLHRSGVPRSQSKAETGDSRDGRIRCICRATHEMDRILILNRREFAAAHRLWMVRREYAFTQGYILKVSPSFSGLIRFLKTAAQYHLIRLMTLPRLSSGRVRNWIQF